MFRRATSVVIKKQTHAPTLLDRTEILFFLGVGQGFSHIFPILNTAKQFSPQRSDLLPSTQEDDTVERDSSNLHDHIALPCYAVALSVPSEDNAVRYKCLADQEWPLDSKETKKI